MTKLDSSAHNLIDAAEKHLTNEQRNFLAVFIGSFMDYFSSLQIILSRLKDTSLQANLYMQKISQKNGNDVSGEISEEKGKALTSLSSLNRLVVLDTESFYLFSDILLDKSVELIRRLFCNVKGVSWDTFQKFINSMSNGKEKKGKNADSLNKLFTEKRKSFKDMQCLIGDYRDDMIVHNESSRKRLTKGFSSSPDGLPQISFGILYPTGNEVVPKSSGDLKQLNSDIEEFLSGLFDLLAHLIRDGKITSGDVE